MNNDEEIVGPLTIKSENVNLEEGEEDFNNNDVSVASITIKHSPKNLKHRTHHFKTEIKSSGSKSLVLTTPDMLDVTQQISPCLSEDENYKTLDQQIKGLEENDPKFKIEEEKISNGFFEKIVAWDIWKIKKTPLVEEEKKIELEVRSKIKCDCDKDANYDFSCKNSMNWFITHVLIMKIRRR